jgi:hypothetical protein
LAGGEFDKPIKDLLLEIKFERKIERAGRPFNEDDIDDEVIDIEDWDYRNLRKGGSLPSSGLGPSSSTSIVRRSSINTAETSQRTSCHLCSSRRLLRNTALRYWHLDLGNNQIRFPQ